MRTGWIIAAIIVILLGVYVAFFRGGNDATAPTAAASGEAAMSGEAAASS